MTAKGPNPSPAEGGVGHALVGTGLESDMLEVTAELTMRYARAVNDESPWYLEEGRQDGVIAPPMFGMVPAMRVLRRAMADGTLPLPVERTVHGKQDMRFVTPIRPGDVLVTEAAIVGYRPRSVGATLDIEFRTRTVAGDERLCQLFTVMVKEQPGPRSPRVNQTERGRPADELSMTVTLDQPHRYAEASFTHGIAPHEDSAIARALGYRTIFLQGQCTLAFAAKAVVDAMAAGDPTRLRRFRARLTGVVYPEDVLSTRLWPNEESGEYAVEMVNQDGATVLADGIAEIGR